MVTAKMVGSTDGSSSAVESMYAISARTCAQRPQWHSGARSYAGMEPVTQATPRCTHLVFRGLRRRAQVVLADLIPPLTPLPLLVLLLAPLPLALGAAPAGPAGPLAPRAPSLAAPCLPLPSLLALLPLPALRSRLARLLEPVAQLGHQRVHLHAAQAQACSSHSHLHGHQRACARAPVQAIEHAHTRAAPCSCGSSAAPPPPAAHTPPAAAGCRTHQAAVCWWAGVEAAAHRAHTRAAPRTHAAHARTPSQRARHLTPSQRARHLSAHLRQQVVVRVQVKRLQQRPRVHLARGHHEAREAHGGRAAAALAVRVRAVAHAPADAAVQVVRHKHQVALVLRRAGGRAARNGAAAGGGACPVESMQCFATVVHTLQVHYRDGAWAGRAQGCRRTAHTWFATTRASANASSGRLARGSCARAGNLRARTGVRHIGGFQQEIRGTRVGGSLHTHACPRTCARTPGARALQHGQQLVVVLHARLAHGQRRQHHVRGRLVQHHAGAHGLRGRSKLDVYPDL